MRIRKEREREGKKTAGDKRREQRSYERVPVCLTVRCRVVGARLAVSLSACQPTHVGTVATGAATARMDSHTDASRRRGRTHDATGVSDAYCYNARTPFRMRVKSETSSARPRRGPALGTSGLHAAIISRGITPVNSRSGFIRIY